MIEFDDDALAPNESASRETIVRLLLSEWPDSPWTWAYGSLPTSDAQETRVLWRGYAHNLVAVVLATPAALLLVWAFVTNATKE